MADNVVGRVRRRGEDRGENSSGVGPDLREGVWPDDLKTLKTLFFVYDNYEI